nr:hypothetical protein [Tanacetum cinerariifolium]
MEHELWNLKVKKYNIVAYTQRFNELALMCLRMVEPERVKVDAYIWGLTDNIKGNLRRKEAKVESFQNGNSSGKGNQRDKSRQTLQNNQRQGNARAMVITPTDGRLPFCERCFTRHVGQCMIKCGKVGHKSRNRCPKKVKKEEVGEVRGRAYAIKDAESKGLNVVTGTFLLNNRYVFVLFDSGFDRSFVDTRFSSMLDIDPVKIETSYEVELADGRVVSTNTVLKGCTLNLVNHVFEINLIPIELVSLRRVVPKNYDPEGERFLIASRFPSPPLACAFFIPRATVTDCCCSKGNVEDKILVPKPPKNYARCARCAWCGHPVDGPYCQGCAFLRKILEEDLVTYFQDFQNTFESSDDSTNIVNAPREPFYGGTHETFQCQQVIFYEPCCENCGGLHENFQCQPLNYYEPNPSYDSNCSGFDQTQPPQFPVIHPPPQETSIEILHDQENVINDVQTFLRKFNRYSFLETPKVLLLAWDRVFEIKGAFGNKQYKPEDIQELFRKLLDDLQNIHEELAEYINSLGWNRPAIYDDDDDDDVDYTIAITPVLSTEESDNSLSMRDEHLDTIPATESDEVIKSSVEDLVLIPSESEGIPDTMCDLHLVNNPTPLEAKDYFEVVINSNDDYSSSDDDSLYYENIEYVEASPLIVFIRLSRVYLIGVELSRNSILTNLNDDPKSNDTMKYPPGFTPMTNADSQSNDLKGVGKEGDETLKNDQEEKQNSEVRKPSSINNSKEDKEESICFSHFQKIDTPHSGGSMLQFMEDLVKVGQAMGNNMEGCLKNIEEIIGSLGANDNHR